MYQFFNDGIFVIKSGITYLGISSAICTSGSFSAPTGTELHFYSGFQTIGASW